MVPPKAHLAPVDPLYVHDLALAERSTIASQAGCHGFDPRLESSRLIGRAYVVTGIYLAVLADDDDADMECSWNRPIPAPPTAPASSPSNISRGTLSNSDFLFADFDIRSSPHGIWHLYSSIHASIFSLGRSLQSTEIARDGGLEAIDNAACEEIFT